MLLSCTSPSASNEQLEKSNFSPKEKTCINKVIAQDDALGKIRNHSCETISLSETIRNYTNGIEKINFEDCPKGFTKAFKEHKNAWIEILVITNKYPNLRGEMHQLFDELGKGEDKESFKPLLDAIWTTWAKVEKSMKKKL